MELDRPNVREIGAQPVSPGAPFREIRLGDGLSDDRIGVARLTRRVFPGFNEGYYGYHTFSDMLEDYGKTCDTSKIPLNLEGIHVIAANVIKTNPADPETYFETLKQWEATVVAAGGQWSLVTSPDQLPKLVTGS